MGSGPPQFVQLPTPGFCTKWGYRPPTPAPQGIKYVKQLKKPPKLPKVSVAILGGAGTGKSTLINKLVGKKVARVGTSVTTFEFKCVHEGELTNYYDIPGSDDRYSYYNVKSLEQAQPLHLIIVLYTKRVTSVLRLEELIHALGVPYVLVRSQVDADIASEGNVDEAKENNVTVEENMLTLTYGKEKKDVDENGKKGHLIYVSSATGAGLDDLRKFALGLHPSVDLTEETAIDTSSKRKRDEGPKEEPAIDTAKRDEGPKEEPAIDTSK